MTEILIVRNPSVPRLFNVVEADFTNETVATLESLLEYDDAVLAKDRYEEAQAESAQEDFA